VTSCPACGFGIEGSPRFCPDCGAALNSRSAVAGEERKVVTALFCDLVGFTASSESADPEDVDHMLNAYFAMARHIIESFGGAVEKFIGDAVVGVFGVPAAHEDDPERAVRAGLRIVEEAEQLRAVDGSPLNLRVGINTGEALVRLGVVPGSGERFLAGDAINTASRIQSVAPEMGVAVGLATYEATSVVFEYVELGAAQLKGKAESVRVFNALAPRARFGTDLTRTHDSPFVGREIDLALLKGIFDKTVAAQSVQLVTIVGEPGLGKSRIVAELFGWIDDRPELVTWRQGRCLPYGEGITFWALGEIVKAHAGILESDAPAAASAKLDAVLPAGDEKTWLHQRLLPLLGIEASSTASREELFTAWRRFLEHVAESSPTVLVFEDVHWADESMLAFIEYLADRAEGVPLLVVGTARPELFERHPAYATALSNVNRLNLAPLSEAETGRLVSALLDTTVLPAELQQPILDRADGNPFYAAEFVRLLKDKDLLIARGSSWALREGAEVPFPDSVQALIAARLDTLTADAKSLLADAAVVGKVFWAGTLAAMGQRHRTDVVDVLRELSRKELVRVSRRSSIEGEAEYAFWHGLTRDVAYAQIPRASRAARHVAAAQWIESIAPDRVDDMADLLAHHYLTALELAQAAGQTDQAAELQAPALRFLTVAGSRALGLDAAAAMTNWERALALTPPGHPDRAETLARFGDAALQSGRSNDAVPALTEAIASFRASGDVPAAARAMLILALVFFGLGDPHADVLPSEALALLEPLPPSAVLVDALTSVAYTESFQGNFKVAIGHAERALGLAEQLGLGRPGRTLGIRGGGRAGLGDPAGLDDMREAIDLATAAGQGRDAAVQLNNLGISLWAFDGPAAALKVQNTGITFATAHGLAEMESKITATGLPMLIDTGEFDRVLDIGARMAARYEAERDLKGLIELLVTEIRVRVLRGDAARVVDRLDWLEASVRETQDPQDLVAGLASAAFARAALSQTQVALALLGEVAATSGARQTAYYTPVLGGMVRLALAAGNREVAERLVEGVAPVSPYSEHALVGVRAALAEADGEVAAAADMYTDAARRWHEFGVVAEEAFALLGAGRCLIAQGSGSGAAASLGRARAIFERLGAAPALAETDALLGVAVAVNE
jgi:class 3 adenylate cyclase/tetratricopeptide (TPR) repeat protein